MSESAAKKSRRQPSHSQNGPEPSLEEAAAPASESPVANAVVIHRVYEGSKLKLMVQTAGDVLPAEIPTILQRALKDVLEEYDLLDAKS